MNSAKVKVVCAVCGKEEYVYPSRAKKYLTCSVECLSKLNRHRYSKKVSKECPVCHKTFEVKRSHSHRRVYCSMECKNKDLPNKYSGSGNPNFKGRTENSDGYKINERFVIHRETVKDILGIEKLPAGLIVHHKDGDKHSNDPHNLILLTHSLHTWIHKNIGNLVFKAIAEGKIDVNTVLSWFSNEEDRQKAEYILNTDCTQQSVVLKQGELLGSPIYG